MTTSTTKAESRKIPTPLYAAAGAGELAYEQLRKLPERVAELRERAEKLRPVVTDAVSDRRIRVDLDKLRDTALRNAQVVVTGAQVAQERAFAVYTDLVARGERVVAGARTEQAKAQLATAKLEIKDAEKTEAVAQVKQHAEDPQSTLPSVPDKAAKRARTTPAK